MGYIDDLRKHIGHAPLFLVGAGIVLLNQQDQVLLQLRSDTKNWGTPGGALELGESFEQGARRELMEETGLEAGLLTLVDIYSGEEFHGFYPNGDEVYLISMMFAARYAGGKIQVTDHEGTDLKFFPLDQLPPLHGLHNQMAIQKVKTLLEGGIEV